MVFKLGGPGRSGIKNKKTNRPWWPDLEPKCVLYFPMNEGGGTSLRDHGGQNNHGTITGASWYKGEALDFDGSDDYVEATKINLAAVGSISIWFNARDVTNAGTLFGTVTADTERFYLGVAGGEARGTFYDGSYNSKSGSVNTNTWYHAVFVWDGSTPKLYLNGVEQTGTTNAALRAAQRTTIGISTNLTDYPFNGIIDEVVVFNEALTAAQIKDLYEKGRSKHGV